MCNPNVSNKWSCISHAHMAIPIVFSTLYGLASTTTGTICTNALTNQNPLLPMTFAYLNGLPSIYPNITSSTCSSGSNFLVGSICTSQSQCAVGTCCGYVYINQWSNSSNTACQQSSQSGKRVAYNANGTYRTSQRAAYNLFVGCSYSTQ